MSEIVRVIEEGSPEDQGPQLDRTYLRFLKTMADIEEANANLPEEDNMQGIEMHDREADMLQTWGVDVDREDVRCAKESYLEQHPADIDMLVAYDDALHYAREEDLFTDADMIFVRDRVQNTVAKMGTELDRELLATACAALDFACRQTQNRWFEEAMREDRENPHPDDISRKVAEPWTAHDQRMMEIRFEPTREFRFTLKANGKLKYQGETTPANYFDFEDLPF